VVATTSVVGQAEVERRPGLRLLEADLAPPSSHVAEGPILLQNCLEEQSEQ
jgi:hypothetical protein